MTGSKALEDELRPSPGPKGAVARKMAANLRLGPGPKRKPEADDKHVPKPRPDKGETFEAAWRARMTTDCRRLTPYAVLEFIPRRQGT